MDISRTNIVVQQVFGQLLCHSFGQCRHQHTLFFLCTDYNLVHQVINLILRWAHLYLWIEQTSRTNKLFNDNTFRFSQLEVSWGSRHIDYLMNQIMKLLETKWTVVKGCRKSETIFHKIFLSGTVTTIHCWNLRYTHMTLIYHHQVIFWEKV